MKAYIQPPPPPVNRRVASNTLILQIYEPMIIGSARRQRQLLVGLGAGCGLGGRELDTGV